MCTVIFLDDFIFHDIGNLVVITVFIANFCMPGFSRIDFLLMLAFLLNVNWSDSIATMCNHSHNDISTVEQGANSMHAKK
jgi:hypothetical protein